MRVQFNFKTYLVEPVYRDDNLFLWDLGDAQPQRSDDQEVIDQAVNLTPGEGGEPADMEMEEGDGELTESEGGTARNARAGRAGGHRCGAGAALPLRRMGLPDRHGSAGLVHAAGESCSPGATRAPSTEVLRRNEDTVNRLTSLIKAVQIQRPLRLKKQLEGDRLDIDACIDAMVDLRSGRAPDPRVQQRLVRNSRDLDALLLLDLSQSTNDWVAKRAVHGAQSRERGYGSGGARHGQARR